jgi:hypothetical protein
MKADTKTLASATENYNKACGLSNLEVRRVKIITHFHPLQQRLSPYLSFVARPALYVTGLVTLTFYYGYVQYSRASILSF